MRYVIRDGKVVPKHSVPHEKRQRADLPAPMVSRFEAMESPVTGETISSWRQRDLDMAAADAYDPRDLAADHSFSRGRAAQARELIDAAGNGDKAGNIWGKWANDTIRGSTSEEPS